MQEKAFIPRFITRMDSTKPEFPTIRTLAKTANLKQHNLNQEYQSHKLSTIL